MWILPLVTGVAAASEPWWDPAWSQRARLLVDDGPLTEPVDALPVLVHLVDGVHLDFADVLQGGDDLAFVDDDGATELAYEVEAWDTAEAWVWVRIPRIEGPGTPDSLWLYYENTSSPPRADPAATWAGFTAVWHLHAGVDDALGAYDFDGTEGSPTAVPGLAGDGRGFDGNDTYYVDANDPSAFDFTTAMTVSVWLRTSSGWSGADADGVLTQRGDQKGWGLERFGSTDQADYEAYLGGSRQEIASGVSVADDQWHQIVGTYDGAAMRLYVDGIERANRAETGSIETPSASKYLVGRENGGSAGVDALDGDLDELRLSATDRPAAWVHADWLSVTDQLIVPCNLGLGTNVDSDGDGIDCECDCDDLDAAVTGGDAYLDQDGDGVGTGPPVPAGCSAPPPGFALAGGDCDDGDPTVFPGATEIPGDEVDQDCDGVETCMADGDGDGAGGTGTVPSADADCDDPGEAEAADPPDCDDGDASRHPAAAELAGDGVDQDCDGLEDCFVDGDDDGARSAVVEPGGAVPDGDCADAGEGTDLDPLDCDDGDPSVLPGVPETPCSGVDEDCDPTTPDAPDGDGDGASSCIDCDDADPLAFPANVEVPCNGRNDDCDPTTADDTDGDGDGVGTCSADCDDADPARYPGNAEVACSGVDEDCDPATPDGADLDGDGVAGCSGDCDDADPGRFPGNPEEPCDGVDQDCDAGTDDDPDDDADGVGLCAGDCDDADPDVFPGAPEAPCTGVDEDCDPLTVDGPDLDGDGVAGCAGDCDDTDPLVHPGAADTACSGADEDCDPGTPDDPDADLDGFLACSGDCDDADPGVNPAATELVCTGVDEDCDPATTDGVDLDGDGVAGCGGDCDDLDADVFPGATEVPCNATDDDCSPATADAPDADADGVSVCDGDCDDADPAAFPGGPEVPCDGRDGDCDPATPDCPEPPGDTGDPGTSGPSAAPRPASSAGPVRPAGCDCRHGSPPGAAWWLLLAAAARRRRGGRPLVASTEGGDVRARLRRYLLPY